MAEVLRLQKELDYPYDKAWASARIGRPDLYALMDQPAPVATANADGSPGGTLPLLSPRKKASIEFMGKVRDIQRTEGLSYDRAFREAGLRNPQLWNDMASASDIPEPLASVEAEDLLAGRVTFKDTGLGADAEKVQAGLVDPSAAFVSQVTTILTTQK